MFTSSEIRSKAYDAAFVLRRGSFAIQCDQRDERTADSTLNAIAWLAEEFQTDETAVEFNGVGIVR